MLHALIMAGGSGTRFWPLSRQALPKQFLTFFGDRSLLQQTMDRLEGFIPAERVLVMTNTQQVAKTSEQLPTLSADQIIGEPMGRDTAACIGVAAAVLAQKDPQAQMVVLAADHLIQPVERFQAALRAAQSLLEENPKALVTFGIPPAWPSTGYGYLKRASKAAESEGISIYRLDSFHEKPELTKAQEYVASGDYYWNSGIFCWQAATILQQVRGCLPSLSAAAERIAAAWGTSEQQEVFFREFQALEKISIDHGVMEAAGKAGLVYMVEAPFQWDDVGSWLALERVLPADQTGNVVVGDHLGRNSRQNVIVAPQGHLVTTLGAEDLIIVVTQDATLVARRSDEQSVKKLLDDLKERGLQGYL